ncbi:MAG: hypothetical protein NVSMB46_06220 [Candidatus Saccharimonadales bacterium]
MFLLFTFQYVVLVLAVEQTGVISKGIMFKELADTRLEDIVVMDAIDNTIAKKPLKNFIISLQYL